MILQRLKAFLKKNKLQNKNRRAFKKRLWRGYRSRLRKAYQNEFKYDEINA